MADNGVLRDIPDWDLLKDPNAPETFDLNRPMPPASLPGASFTNDRPLAEPERPQGWGERLGEENSPVGPGPEQAFAAAVRHARAGEWDKAANYLPFLAALVGPSAKMSPRTLAALERAKAIAGDTSLKLSPGQRTEKAWQAGGQYGGWDQIPVRIGPDGKPEMEWVKHIPTFDPAKPVFKEGTFPAESRYLRDNKVDKAKGTAGDLLNLNPELLKLHPDLADIRMKLAVGDIPVNKVGGGYREPGWFSKEGITAKDFSKGSLAETLAHELGGHAMQQRLGWENGSGPAREMRPWISNDEAFNRYEKTVGEQNANLNMNLDTNKTYKAYDPAARIGSSFPSYEQNPNFDPKARRGSAASKFSIERKIEGEQPRSMPPSWQYSTKPEDMRTPAGIGFPMLWHGLKWGAGTYAVNRLLDALFGAAPKKEDKDTPPYP